MDENLNEATRQEPVNVIETGIQEEIVIEIDESTGWVRGDGTLHYSIAGRDEDDQHPISAITGLRHELNQIKALQTVASNKIGVAHYYEWYDGAHSETGYFVTIEPGTSAIKICDGSNIFGVVVDEAGFVGGQGGITLDYVNGDTNVYAAARDNSYGLVATSGLVSVRCESDVAKGDYVISNAYGMATKTDSGFGYQVVAIEDKNGVNYASIALGVQSCITDLIGKNLQHLDERMGNAESNIVAATNAANQAYNKAAQSNIVSEDAILKALEAINKADGALSATDTMNGTLSSVGKTAQQARAIAESAVNSANEIRKEAEATANNALSNVNDLIKKFEPIDEWIDPATGQVGAEYIITYMDNQGLATKSEVQTVESLSEENKSLIEKNAQNITTLVASVDKYSVGEYSQAYGLTLEQARTILKEGMIYIPTKHGDVATHSEKYNDGENVPLEREFTNGFYYEWTTLENNTLMWSEGLGKVWFGTAQPAGDAYTYWYDNDKLYLLNNGAWSEVATLAGNVNNRITSMIRQDVDEISAEIVNAYGAVAGFGAKLSETDARVNSIASWPTDGGAHNMAVLESKSDGDGSYLVLAAVTDVNGNPEVTELNGAKIVLKDSNKNGSSYIQVDADQIAFTGEVTFLKPDDLGENGTTVIDGGRIKTGTLSADTIHGGTIDATDVTIKNLDADQITSGEITAKHINADGLKITNGTYSGTLSVGGTVASPNFKVDANGNVVMNGNINLNGSISWGNNDVLTGAADVYEILSENSRFGCFYEENGSLYINASYIQSGVIDADYIDVDGIITANNLLTKSGEFSGHLNVASGSRCNIFTTIYLNNTSTYFLSSHQSNLNNLTVTGVFDASGNSFTSSAYNISFGNANSYGSLNGTWKLNSAELTTSDQNAKNSIADIDSRYSILFDNLTPRIYKYNDGTSGRYHIGFIAQEVDEALQKAGISRQEFAGVCIDTSEDGVEYWALRYDEFIALNTHEIQKLKSEVEDLKSEIAELKAMINGGEKV